MEKVRIREKWWENLDKKKGLEKVYDKEKTDESKNVK